MEVAEWSTTRPSSPKRREGLRQGDGGDRAAMVGAAVSGKRKNMRRGIKGLH